MSYIQNKHENPQLRKPFLSLKFLSVFEYKKLSTIMSIKKISRNEMKKISGGIRPNQAFVNCDCGGGVVTVQLCTCDPYGHCTPGCAFLGYTNPGVECPNNTNL
jgi:hypothetical protein